jgi:hypothetical protein
MNDLTAIYQLPFQRRMNVKSTTRAILYMHSQVYAGWESGSIASRSLRIMQADGYPPDQSDSTEKRIYHVPLLLLVIVIGVGV